MASVVGQGLIGVLGGSVVGYRLRDSGSSSVKSLSGDPGISLASGGDEVGVAGGGQVLGLGAVNVEPPVADEVLLVEDGSIGAEEGVLGQATLGVVGTDVEGLALSLGISIVT